MTKVIRPNPKDKADGMKIDMNAKQVDEDIPLEPRKVDELEEMLVDGAIGFKDSLSYVIGSDVYKLYDNDPKKLIPLYMLIRITPCVDRQYKVFQKITGVNEIEITYLSYMLGIPEERLKELPEDKINNLAASLSEASINTEISPAQVSIPILALSSETLGRPLLGAAIKIAIEDGFKFETKNMHNKNKFTALKEVERLSFPTMYIKLAKGRYNAPDDIYFAALRIIEESKKVYEEEWK